MAAKISYQIEDYIYQNRNDFIGFSMKPNAHKRWIAHEVNKEHGTNLDQFDVIATLEYLKEMGLLREAGMWGFDQLYTVKKENES